MSIHAGEIPLDEVAEHVSTYLGGFAKIVETYRSWSDQWLEPGAFRKALEGISKWHATRITEAFQKQRPTVYEAYNVATYYATHQMRSYRTAFDLLERINRGFQRYFPAGEEPHGSRLPSGAEPRPEAQLSV
jgi:hypothetical protein